MLDRIVAAIHHGLAVEDVVVHLEGHGLLLPFGVESNDAPWCRAAAPEEGPIGTAFSARRTVLAAPTPVMGGRSCVTTVLHGATGVIGTLTAVFLPPRELSADEVGVIEFGATLASFALAGLELERRTRHERRRLAVVLQRAARAAAATELGPAIQSLVEECAALLRCDTVIVFERVKDGVSPVGGYGVDIDLLRGHVLTEDEVGLRLAGARSTPLVVDRRGRSDTLGIGSLSQSDVLVIAATVVGGEVVGLIVAGWDGDEGVDPNDVLLVEGIADVLALGLAAARQGHSGVRTADELEKLHSDFISTLSHELRTPLAVVKGAVETLQAHGDALDDAMRARLLERIRYRIDQEVELVDSLLSLSRLDRGMVRLDPQPFDLCELCRGVASDHMEAVSRLVGVDGPTEAPLVADRVALRQVVSNLVGNALKFSEGPVRIGIERTHESWHVTVDDDGVGIPPPVRDRVFDRFFQLGDARRRGGVGVGLAVVRGFVELHRGRVGVDSSPMGGARFWFDIPDVTS